MNIPNDAAILLSFINTKLRDFYGSFDELCDDLQLDKNIIENKLRSIGYEYNENQNRFV